MSAVGFAGVGKAFGGNAALAGIDLDIAAGSFVALIGTSGSGKTTLLKTINRLVVPDSGTVSVDGVDVASVDAVALRRGIGTVFQNVGLFPHMDVAANIASVPRLLGWSRAKAAARVIELLDLVDLPADVAARLPAELSGGQRQRVGVARALAAGPRLMLLDEPFGALDPTTRDALATRYRDLHGRLGLTSIMVTHDVQEALLLADRIVVLRAGRIVADATPAALMAGAGDAGVAAMIAVPRDQAARLAEMARG
ncbi:ATP-binding cassette domain-containing protein [Glacieibacterium frigidum]|uniref:ATP-binding cassette domain-containing protein n=1 Tax=Glacieibacterium frigidum TaxID=2593303 RepID=A0A552UF77_9SPHN|nr:ATP-binding cassette domain-containing protein [Glacieibacterium frigidum]TRW16872.1 ATP-binding cassette domain-containing protein [Glacieibacterium frigidum]